MIEIVYIILLTITIFKLYKLIKRYYKVSVSLFFFLYGNIFFLFQKENLNPPSCTCSDSHVRSACIWLDTLCILVHFSDNITLLYCYYTRPIYIFHHRLDLHTTHNP